VVRARARNFYHGLRLTPEPRRGAIYAIYAWMRAADDIADGPEPELDRQARLDAHRSLTAQALEGGHTSGASDEPHALFWPAFAHSVRTYGLEATLFDDMLAGLEEDLAKVTYATEVDLTRYCYRVASTVGLACIGIWGLRPGADPAHARRLAVARGQAFQRTNILRDFAQDYDQPGRRVYLPAAALSARGVTADQLRAWADPDRCAAVIAEQAAAARAFYRDSTDLESLIDPACAPTLWAMTRIYSGILRRIEDDPACIVGQRRVRLGGMTKASIAVSAALRARAGRWSSVNTG
jgi:phytoene synthase